MEVWDVSVSGAAGEKMTPHALLAQARTASPSAGIYSLALTLIHAGMGRHHLADQPAQLGRQFRRQLRRAVPPPPGSRAAAAAALEAGHEHAQGLRGGCYAWSKSTGARSFFNCTLSVL